VLMQYVGGLVDVPDPMHLDPEVEQDEPLAIDQHHYDQDSCYRTLQALFAGPTCYVTRDRWLLMDPSNPRDKLLPDLLVARNVPQANRMEYDPVVEGKPPDLLAEFLSDSSLRADLVEKVQRYQELGVREYLVFNPSGIFHQPLIQGWDLQASRGAAPLSPDAGGGVTSRILPVRFVIINGNLTLFDSRTGDNLSDYERANRRAREANEARIRAEAEHTREAALRRDAEADRAREAALRRDAEAVRAREAALRQDAEERVRQLQAELDRLRDV